MVLHHCLPLAMPGMLTGSTVGMALGQEGPAADDRHGGVHRGHPRGFTDPATVLPVRAYLWAHSPERAFVEKTRKRAIQGRTVAHRGGLVEVRALSGQSRLEHADEFRILGGLLRANISIKT
jgi:hypothetical protein